MSSDAQEAGEDDPAARKLGSYWFTFNTTGNDAIDAILEAVAQAGKAYHHTREWADPDNGEPTHVACIQAAANAAAKLRAAYAAPNEGEGTGLRFPRAKNDGKGWTIDPDYLEAIRDDAREDSGSVSLEDVENILLSAQRQLEREATGASNTSGTRYTDVDTGGFVFQHDYSKHWKTAAQRQLEREAVRDAGMLPELLRMARPFVERGIVAGDIGDLTFLARIDSELLNYEREAVRAGGLPTPTGVWVEREAGEQCDFCNGTRRRYVNSIDTGLPCPRCKPQAAGVDRAEIERLFLDESYESGNEMIDALHSWATALLASRDAEIASATRALSDANAHGQQLQAKGDEIAGWAICLNDNTALCENREDCCCTSCHVYAEWKALAPTGDAKRGD